MPVVLDATLPVLPCPEEQWTKCHGRHYVAHRNDVHVFSRRWDLAADSLLAKFNRMFVNTADTLVYDHLNADGTPDRQYRPNMLYALDMVADTAVVMKETRDAWRRLVYPWGVASLDQNDPQFHPYHENWHHYHKDDAYHNGTVWLWNNGMAMQRMIEAGQQDIAWQLLKT